MVDARDAWATATPYEVLERAHVKALGVFKVVHNAAGCAYDNVGPLGQGDRLGHVVDTADDHGRAHADVCTKALKVFGDLERELAEIHKACAKRGKGVGPVSGSACAPAGRCVCV